MKMSHIKKDFNTNQPSRMQTKIKLYKIKQRASLLFVCLVYAVYLTFV